MPNKRTSMRKIRDILRQKWELGQSDRAISKSCSVSKTTVKECVCRAERAGLGWPLPEDLDDARLEATLYPGVKNVNTRMMGSGTPDWEEVYTELKKKEVTLRLLWEELRERNPEAWGYSWYCEQFAQWKKKRRISMRQIHKAGEKLFVDFAGKTVPIYDRATGKATPCQIFVACWGASHFTFAQAVWSQDLASWVSAHVNAFEYFGCVPEIVIPDNLRSGVSKACRYDPDINPTYAELADHYGFAVIPARSYKPKDKAKAEVGVQLVTRWILGALRKRKFFSIAELNAAIGKLLEKLNDKPFQKKDGTRRKQFHDLDRPAARPLPARVYEYAEVVKATVNIDYHVEVKEHYYSVPYQLRGERLICRVTARAIEVLLKNRRIWTHTRSFKKYDYTTVAEHMPESHRKHLEWTPSRIISWAESIGTHTATVVTAIMENCRHPEQGYRGCLGIFRLGKRFGNDRVELACGRAIAFKAFRYRHIKNILERGLERHPVGETGPVNVEPIHHANVRGGDYYRQSAIGGLQHDDKPNS